MTYRALVAGEEIGNAWDKFLYRSTGVLLGEAFKLELFAHNIKVEFDNDDNMWAVFATFEDFVFFKLKWD